MILSRPLDFRAVLSTRKLARFITHTVLIAILVCIISVLGLCVHRGRFPTDKDLVSDGFAFLPRSVALSLAHSLACRRGVYIWSGTRYPIPELLAAPPPSTFRILPRLTAPARRTIHTALPPAAAKVFGASAVETRQFATTAFLAYHVFTTMSEASASMRAMHRAYWHQRIPQQHHHLVDFKFVLCSPPEKRTGDWVELATEQREHGDLMILDEGREWSDRMMENMDDGKTYRWMQEVIRQGAAGMGREAWWYMKADDDTYTQFPRLLEWLAAANATKPVYTGSTEFMPLRPNRYFSGHAYALSWPLINTIVAARLDDIDTGLAGRSPEDALMGGWMYSLPSEGRGDAIAERIAPQSLDGWNVLNPDPVSGLLRLEMAQRALWGPVDVEKYVNRADSFWAAKRGLEREIINVHQVKTPDSFLRVHSLIEGSWDKVRRGEAADSKKAKPMYAWTPPAWLLP